MNIDEIPVGHAENLTGQKFGLLTVLYRVKNQGHRTAWKCRCDCGNECIVEATHLKTGNTRSCGCIRIRDLTGLRFGKLVVLGPIETRDTNRCINWRCLCDCGNECIVSSHNLVVGHTKSCGCLLSAGEEKIASLYRQHHIFYEQQKYFDSCRFENTGAPAYFDFYVNNNFLLEFDGIQHFKYKNSGWDTKENFENTQRRDAYKNQWCKENSIPLIRIPYTKLDTLCIDDLLLETTRFRVI